MISLTASKLLVVEGVEEDRFMRERAKRLRGGVEARETRTVDDAGLNEVVEHDLAARPRHGMYAEIEPIIIFNRFRFDDTEEERKRRISAFPALNQLKFNGYGGFEWRDSGSPQFRKRTGLVCQPAWQLHTIVGCHFRCAYCNLGHFVNIMMNMENFVLRLDGWIERCPAQTLFQYDNFTDTVCFEPEYGGAKLLIEYFAMKPGKALELYVGKSDHVDFLLDYDHRGHTVCCWSVSARTQSVEFEWKSAPMEARIEAMRKCQKAGYAVRARFSPIIPVRNWREENREMIELLFSRVEPDLITIEPLRFLDYDAMNKSFDLSFLDEEFIEIMKEAAGRPHAQGCEVPDEYRKGMYRFIIDELERVSPETPFAFCREKRDVWEYFAADFARHGQGPDRYICNCGPYSAPAMAHA